MKIKTLLTISVMSILVLSCDRPQCENTNVVFDTHAVGSVEYNEELKNQLEKIGQENFTYWFDSYVENNGNEFILVNIQNDSLCAKGLIRVKEWRQLEEIKRTRGAGFSGAELQGLQIGFNKESQITEMTFKDIDKIID